MGRIGVRFDEVREFADKLAHFKNLRVEGLMTHFAAADNLRENEFTNEQIGVFIKRSKFLKKKDFVLFIKIWQTLRAPSLTKIRGEIWFDSAEFYTVWAAMFCPRKSKNRCSSRFSVL
jgi:predicted amino acid racemase